MIGRLISANRCGSPGLIPEPRQAWQDMLGPPPDMQVKKESAHPLLLESDEDEEDEDESSELLGGAAACCAAAICLGMSARSARILSVRPPSPMDVKKLMLKRMFRAVSCATQPFGSKSWLAMAHPAMPPSGKLGRAGIFAKEGYA